MHKKTIISLWPICAFMLVHIAYGQDTNKLAKSPSYGNPTDVTIGSTELVRYQNEFSFAHIESARMSSKHGLAVIFEGTEDLHYYAKSETASAPGFELKVQAKSNDIEFGKPIFPKWKVFQDPTGSKIEVYAGNFTIFVPIVTTPAQTKTTVSEMSKVEVKITGIACTGLVCLPPFEKTIQAKIDFTKTESWREISLEKPSDTSGPEPATRLSYSSWFAFTLAFLAGLGLNIMPCVWPVLPLIVMRIVEQAQKSKGKSAAMGLAFCLGILLFFASLACANIILRIFYGTVLQWGDQFRNPAFVAAMALLLVVLALFMFGLFTITVPSSIASKSGSGKGYTGTVGMGFLAAILSTPCSFGILAAAFAWAQAQPLMIATLAIMVIGIGMAMPYAILTSMPALLKRLPKSGRWMELFKQTIGFILLIIAIKLIEALPEARRISVLYFAVVLAFSVWMWSSWVSYNTKPARKWLIRLIAIALAFASGWIFLPAPAAELIDWQNYDSTSIDTAINQNQPVLIKFTADWCLSCKTVDKLVYSRKDIARLIEQKAVLPVKADTTERSSPATIALKDIYNEPGVPVNILFIPAKKEPIKWRGILFADKLKKALTQLDNPK
jgi:thiol:disulfide interchange protein